MSETFARTDSSVLGNWWWTVDRWLLVSLAMLISVGVFLNFASSPAVAERIGVDMFHFVRRQLIFMPAAIGCALFLSFQTPKSIRRLAIMGFVITLGLLVMTLVSGAEIKGATRWVRIGGISVQPSEFIKPSFCVVSAWLFAGHADDKSFPGHWLSVGLYFVVASILLMQPDVGQTTVISCVWAFQFFLAGLPMIWVISLFCAGVGGIFLAYHTFSHVQLRIDRFLNADGAQLGYQVRKSLAAFENGGLFGRGPGEGVVKRVLPDAHTDFVLAVAGEEFGLILCLFVVLLFGFIVLRGFKLFMNKSNLFVLIAGSGLLAQFGLQAFINMASTLHLMPPKGMTLPFISYGGSSLVALAIGMGMMLGLARCPNDAGELQ